MFHGAAWAFVACAVFLCGSVKVSAAAEGSATAPKSAKGKTDAVVTKRSMSLTGMDTKTTGGVAIDYALGLAGSWFEVANGRISLREPETGETNHLMISVKDAESGRDIPECQITAYARAGNDKNNGTTFTLIPAWGAESLQYIANFSLPADTTSSVYLRVNVAPPGLARRSISNEDLFQKNIDVEWSEATISKDLVTTASASSGIIETKGAVLKGRHSAVTPTPYPGQK